MEDYLVRNFELYYPSRAKNAVRYYEKSPYELIVTMNDGTILSYYDHLKSIRQLPDYCKPMTKEQVMREFGLRLSRRMHYEGITQTELSEKTGITQTRLSHYAGGKAMPNFYNLVKISQVLGCTIDDFTSSY